MPNSEQAPQSGYPAGIGRRLGAALYDALLIIAIWMLTLFAWISGGEGEAVSGWYVQLVLGLEWAAFYAYAWHRGGQTLGMRAWRIHLVNEDGVPPRLGSIVVRLLVAPLSVAILGGGYLWMYTNDRRQTWHDALSNTLVVHVPKDKKSR